MRIALAQLNPTVGDVAGNTRRVIDAIEVARRAGADLLLTSELVLLGYPPRDLLLREGVTEACEAAVREIAERAGSMVVVVGHPRRAAAGLRFHHNAVSVCRDGAVLAVYDKRLLPGYDIFDEDRYFTPGAEPGVIDLDGRRIGLAVCEDLWQARDAGAPCRYPVRPVIDLAAAGCDLLLSLNASPFVLGKWTSHVRALQALATEHGLPVAAVNQVGGNDDLIFDGRSIVVGADGTVIGSLPGWREAVEVFDLDGDGTDPTGITEPDLNEELWGALV
ncbi:MAG: nitrilase-related carbon-nitrogen hydrolase, partial [Planctomycetota bacterium]